MDVWHNIFSRKYKRSVSRLLTTTTFPHKWGIWEFRFRSSVKTLKSSWFIYLPWNRVSYQGTSQSGPQGDSVSTHNFGQSGLQKLLTMQRVRYVVSWIARQVWWRAHAAVCPLQLAHSARIPWPQCQGWVKLVLQAELLQRSILWDAPGTWLQEKKRVCPSITWRHMISQHWVWFRFRW